MKKSKRIFAALLAGIVLTGTVAGMDLFGKSSYTYAAYNAGTTYDATEEYLKLQPVSYNYNGHKMRAFSICNDYLSTEVGTREDGTKGMGEGMSFVTGDTVKEGDKLVIEFKEPIDSTKIEVLTFTIKQVPGNEYYAYCSEDLMLSTPRKKFAVGTYDLEKVSFQTKLFANSEGMVEAIVLKNVKADANGQLFLDCFTVSQSPYKKDVIYDASEDYLKVQSAKEYNGVSIVSFSHRSTFWSEEAKLETDNGYALFASKYEGATSVPITKGDNMVLEFVHSIDSKKLPYINLTFAVSNQSGTGLDFYNVNEIKNGALGEVKASGEVKFWEFVTISLKTADFADRDGYVDAIAMKVTGETAETFSVGAFAFSKNPKSLTSSSTPSTGEKLKDTKNQFDGTDENFVIHTSEEYKGIKILPFGGYNDYLSQVADGGKGMGEGYALYTSRFVEQGDVVVLEFVKPIDSKKDDIITLALKHVPGNTWGIYKGTDTKFANKIKEFEVGSYSIEFVAIRTSMFAESDGKVRSIFLKNQKSSEQGQLFVDGYSLGKDPYQLGVTYDMTEEYVKVQTVGSYKGLKTGVFNERSIFWSTEAKRETDEGYALIGHKEDGSSLQEGDILILEFVTDISAQKFEILDLTLATSSRTGATFEVYNVNEIKNGQLGEAKQQVSADFWDFKGNTLPLSAYADENGYVSAIALKLVSEAADTFSVGAFSLMRLSDLVEEGGQDILNNAIVASESEETYDFLIEFNKAGTTPSNLTEKELGEHISINGVKVSDMNKDGEAVQVQWQLIGRYYLKISVDKDYAGEGAIINAQRKLVGNYIDIEKELPVPDKSQLSNAFRLHIYAGENVTEVKEDRDYMPVTINRMESIVDENGNLKIDVHFSDSITGTTLYYACNPDAWCKKNLIPLNTSTTTYYDTQLMENFILGGYKSTLLDNVIINGDSIAEWLVTDEISGSTASNSAIMVHYGMSGNKVATIFIAVNSHIGKELIGKYEEDDLRVTYKEGLNFTTCKEVQENTTFVYSNGTWEKTKEEDFAVYYDGKLMTDGDHLKVIGLPSEKNIEVVGIENYEIQTETEGTVVTFTIMEEGQSRISFTVEGTKIVPVESGYDLPIVICGIALAAILVVMAVLLILQTKKRGKKHEEQ